MGLELTNNPMGREDGRSGDGDIDPVRKYPDFFEVDVESRSSLADELPQSLSRSAF